MPIRKKTEVKKNKEVENSEGIETKHCPFCDNEIRIRAIKCQYCGEFLNEETLNKKTKEVEKVNDNAKINKKTGQSAIKLMKFLGSIVIVLGIVTITSPIMFRMFLDRIIGILLIVAGILWMVNIYKDKWKYLGIGFIVLGVGLILSYFQFVGTIMIWMFAFWTLLRYLVLLSYSIKNKQKIWCFFIMLMLFILFIILTFSDKTATMSSGICIGGSTIIDGLLLIILPNTINRQKNICK